MQEFPPLIRRILTCPKGFCKDRSFTESKAETYQRSDTLQIIRMISSYQGLFIWCGYIPAKEQNALQKMEPSSGIEPLIFPIPRECITAMLRWRLKMETRAGIEPAKMSFAETRLTFWLPRRKTG